MATVKKAKAKRLEEGCVVLCRSLDGVSPAHELVSDALYQVVAINQSGAAPSIKLRPLDGKSACVGYVKFTTRRFKVTRSRAEVDKLIAFS